MQPFLELMFSSKKYAEELLCKHCFQPSSLLMSCFICRHNNPCCIRHRQPLCFSAEKILCDLGKALRLIFTGFGRSYLHLQQNAVNSSFATFSFKWCFEPTTLAYTLIFSLDYNIMHFLLLLIIDLMRNRIKSGTQVADGVSVQTDPRIAITNNVCHRNQCLLR